MEIAESNKQEPALSQILFPSTDHSFANFCVVESNVQATEAALLFSLRQHPLVALVGPTGWGKSHLLQAASIRLADEMGVPVPVIDAAEYTGWGRTSVMAPLVMDNIQVAYESAQVAYQLRILLESRVQSKALTLVSITAPRITRGTRNMLPNHRQWNIVAIEAPEARERQVIVDKLAQQEGITLAPLLQKLIAQQMNGNGRTICGALHRLRLYDSQFTSSEAILRALGMIDIFFRDNSSWDLKGTIRAAAKQTGASDELAMAVYAMHRNADLPEGEVARAVELMPGEVYNRSTAFGKELQASATSRQRYKEFVRKVLELLLEN